MELQYIVLTIIKILISVPTLVLVIQLKEVHSAALIGGHVNNANVPSTKTNNITEFKIDLSEDNTQDETRVSSSSSSTETKANANQNQTDESVPDPEPLIVPGYNLPENIFNKGKPFYLEKDPLTGNIDFNSKSKLYEEYEYDDVEYDKSSIERKDGPSSGSHKPSDINQLTPNFHDFLNLPVKYNPDKYVYPLISSSYANTKVQGNVNKHQNHKNYVVTTYKPTLSPTYFTTKYFHAQDKIIEYSTPKKSYEYEFTTATPVKVQSTKRIENLMNSPMNHPSYNEEYYKKPAILTTQKAVVVASSTTTKRPMTLFEQLFGSDYEENEGTEPTTTTTTSSSVSTAVPSKTTKPYPVPQGNGQGQNQGQVTGQQIHLFNNLSKKANTPPTSSNYPNVLSGSNMGDMNVNYDYEEEEKPAQVAEVPKKNQVQSVTPSPSVPSSGPHSGPPSGHNSFEQSPENPEVSDEYEYDYMDKTTMPASSSPKVTSPSFVFPSSSLSSTEQTHSSATPNSYSPNTNVVFTTTTTESTKMTSLPLGENHIHHNHNHQQQPHPNRPILVASQNLREQLNGEKVGYVHPQAPSTSSIHIAPDQDTVSFVMGNHQNVEGAEANANANPGGYVGTSLKESPYESNPFRPVYDQQPDEYQVKNDYHQRPFLNKLNTNSAPASAVTIQPIKSSEASLSIGTQIALKPGHVVDETIEDVDYTKGSKIVFPDSVDKSTTYTPDLSPPPPPILPGVSHRPGGPGLNLHKEVLKLSSKPMFHQLPSELTPPESGIKVPQRVRPPWDPRPGHFHAGRPEYASRPPRPQEVYKRVDTLPNILPQFRPNMSNKPHHHAHAHGPHGHGQYPHYDRNHHPHPHQHHQQQQQHGPNQHKHLPPPPQQQPAHHQQQNYARQPLLERPSNNRPIGFFEKLHPPPPPSQSKIPSKVAEDRIGSKPLQPGQGQVQQNLPPMQEHFAFLKAPPKVVVSNRRSGEDPETLQMIQAKQEHKKTDKPSYKPLKPDIKDNLIKDREIVTPSHMKLPSLSPSFVNTDKPLYVVYPVNSPPIKLDALDNNKKESVVIGTRAELPLPPSKIANPTSSIATESDFKYEVKDRHDSPILKPRPATFPIKSDFPYALERPDPVLSALGGSSDMENKLQLQLHQLPDEPTIISSNQWNTIEDTEPRIVNHNHNTNSNNQISVTLKTYTEKPIAVAYTPTESNSKLFAMPNYAGLVIPEMRDSEITVSAVMHHGVHGQQQPEVHRPQPHVHIKHVAHAHHEEASAPRPQQEFQAPFQASAHVDHALSQGWAVVREADERKDEATTPPVLTTSEFDIENFKPQLEGGFKPIYSYPDDKEDGKKDGKGQEVVINERQE